MFDCHQGAKRDNHTQMLPIVAMQLPSDCFFFGLCTVDRVGLLWSPPVLRVYWAAQQRGNSGWMRQNSNRSLMRSQWVIPSVMQDTSKASTQVLSITEVPKLFSTKVQIVVVGHGPKVNVASILHENLLHFTVV